MKLQPILITVAFVCLVAIAALEMGIFPALAISPLSDWTNIGSQSSIDVGSSLSIFPVAQTYDTLIAQQHKTVANLANYQGCTIPVNEVRYYQQIADNRYIIVLKTGGLQILDSETDAEAFYTCPNSGALIRMNLNPRGCSAVTNPYPQDYRNYQTCSGFASVTYYIPNNEIRDTECAGSEQRTAQCWDGSTIVTANCVNRYLVPTTNLCPVRPPTSTNQTNQTTCGVSSCQANQTTGCTNTCPTGTVWGANCSCLTPARTYFGMDKTTFEIVLASIVMAIAALIYTRRV